MPIGVTVSGEIVFPFQCKDFIDQHKTAKQDRVAPQEQSGAHEKATADLPDNAAATPEIKVPETITREPDQPVVKLDQQKATSEDGVAPLGKPDATQEKAAAAQPDGAAPESKVPEPVGPATVKPAPGLLAKTHALRDAGLAPTGSPKGGPPGCAHFRTYDAESHTYMTFGGQRRPCL
jgi:hypothetical protein